MWKYGSALQQRPELNPYSGRGATSHNWHAPKPHRKQVLGVLKGEESRGRGRADRVHGGGGPRVSRSVHGGPGARGWRRSAPWVPRVSRTRGRGRLTAGPTWQPRGRARGRPRRHGRRERRARAPMVAAGDQRRGGAAPEREEGRGKRTERSTAHPKTAKAVETADGAEEDGGAARDDDDDGAPAVDGRSGAADGVGDHSAKRTEVSPSKEEVRSGGGGGTELGGDGGESGARREHESDGESEWRAAETEERISGNVFIASGGREGGRGGRKPAAGISAAIDCAGDECGHDSNESEGEREGKEGETGEGNAGSNSPLIKARGEGGMRRIQRRRRR
uniref:Pr1-like protein n=1 Tax=Oryza sativa subsp. japonica TaxID=39947 RepID=Q5VMS8_ORYSJ|nr:pr1-like protein [Oryza sativa Japonica Group]